MRCTVVAALLSIGACGGSPSGLPSSFTANPAVLDAETNAWSGLLVVVPYPQSIDAPIEDPFAEAYSARRVKREIAGPSECGPAAIPARQHLRESLLDTAYYAAELFRSLQARLPPDSVALGSELNRPTM